MVFRGALVRIRILVGIASAVIEILLQGVGDVLLWLFPFT